jgi:hypothetical protein
MQIGDIYRWWVFTALAVGEVETLTFLPWIPLLPGSKEVECWAPLCGDENPGNNTLRGSVFVRGCDGTAEPGPGLRIKSVSPNPTFACTEVAFTTPRWRFLNLTVHDLAGRQVRELANAAVGPGLHRVKWDGRDRHGRLCAEGVYIVRLEADGVTDQAKLILRR